MTNIRLHILFLFFIVSAMTISSQAFAVGFFDPASGASQTLNTIEAGALKVETFYNETIKGNLSEWKSKFDKFTSSFKKKNKESKIPGTKEIVESKIAKNDDENSVKKAIETIAFRYTSPMEIEQRKYNEKGQELFEDVIIEASTAVDSVEKNLIIIDKQIADAMEDSGEAEDYNSSLYSSYKMDMATDQVLTRMQELMAIQAMAKASRAIADDVDPLYYGPVSSGIQFN